MPLTRFEDWPARLAAFLEARRCMSFEWGSNDCVLFAIDAVREITGLDAGADIRGKYTSALGAARLMKKLYGAATLPEAAPAFAARWGGQEIAPGFAGRGDTVLHEEAAGPALGVCVGRQFAAVSGNGVVMLPMRLAVKAWRI